MVKLPGWQQMKPITVDRVGTFYRIAHFVENNSANYVQVYIIIIIIINSMMSFVSVCLDCH